MIISSRPPTRTQRRIGIAFLCLVVVYFGSLFRQAAQTEAERSAWIIGTDIVRRMCGRTDFGPVAMPKTDSPVTYEGQVIECQLTSSPFIWKTSLDGVPMTCADLKKHDLFFACSSGKTWDGRRIFIFGGGERPKALRDRDVDWKTQTLK